MICEFLRESGIVISFDKLEVVVKIALRFGEAQFQRRYIIDKVDKLQFKSIEYFG